MCCLSCAMCHVSCVTNVKYSALKKHLKSIMLKTHLNITYSNLPKDNKTLKKNQNPKITQTPQKGSLFCIFSDILFDKKSPVQLILGPGRWHEHNHRHRKIYTE